MKLSKALEELDTRSAKLHMYLAGLRVPEELEGVIEYARMEAEAIFDRVTYLEMMVKHNEVPDADFPGPVASMQTGVVRATAERTKQPGEVELFPVDVFAFKDEGRA